MKNKSYWLLLSSLIVAAMMLASLSSCAKSTTSTTASHTISTISTATGNWWDSLGKPQYGGTMTVRMATDIVNWDPFNREQGTNIMSGWLEKLWADDWTKDPSVYNYSFQYRGNENKAGNLITNWEFTDQNTISVKVRQGVYWQNIPPVNGREFNANDIVAHYNRLFGLDGTKGSPYYTGDLEFSHLVSVTATDNFTVVFKWKNMNPDLIEENLEGIGAGGGIEAPEAVKQWGDLNDWHHAIGTGPFTLQNFVSGVSATLARYPSYWGHDERYPQNQLPYLDSIQILIIPDSSTALAAMRSGKIDQIDGIGFNDAANMKQTNPEILQISQPDSGTPTIDPNDGMAPFNDIRVRQAMQMALDLPSIAKNYYKNTTGSDPSSLTCNTLPGWGFPYSQWPADLKAQYAYDPTKAKQLLADAGYATGFNTTCAADNSGDLALLQAVKSYFAAVNINMTIQSMDSASLGGLTFGQKFNKTSMMAFQSTGGLGLQYEPSRQIDRYVSNGSANYENIADPAYDAFWVQAFSATDENGVKQALIGANKYLAGQHYLISLVTDNQFCLYWPWLKGYDGQALAISGGNVGPGYLFFYGARFWIDQSLKKSMGH